MDRLVHFFGGGKVKENGEFESMTEQPPSFYGWVISHCRERFGWPLTLNGRFDCGKERPHYVLMALSCVDDWGNCKEVVKSSIITCLEVVVGTGV